MFPDQPRIPVHPLNPLMKDAARDSISVEIICDTKESKGHVVDPHELSEGFVVVVELGGMDDETIYGLHSCFLQTVSPPQGFLIMIFGSTSFRIITHWFVRSFDISAFLD